MRLILVCAIQHWGCNDKEISHLGKKSPRNKSKNKMENKGIKKKCAKGAVGVS